MVPDHILFIKRTGLSGEVLFRLSYDEEMHAIVVEQPGGRIQIPLANCVAAAFEDDYHRLLDNVVEYLDDLSIASV